MSRVAEHFGGKLVARIEVFFNNKADKTVFLDTATF
jgi:hypothetical protein